MPWYAIQTYTGREERLAAMVRRILPGGCYGECFVPYFERLRRFRGQCQVQVLRMFPGYVLISTDDVGAVFQRLKGVPAMSKVLEAGAFEFSPMEEGEARFLTGVLDAEHIARLTYAATDGKGNVTYMSGPLERCGGRVESYRFRERYARVRVTIAGQERTARMGIILSEDIRREAAYGKVEARVPAEGAYVPLGGAGAGGAPGAGERVAVVGGALEGTVAVVSGSCGGSVTVTVRMFGRDMPVRMPACDVRRIGPGE